MSTVTTGSVPSETSAIWRLRRGIYYLAGLAGVLMFLAFTGDVLLLTVLGWTAAVGAELSIHRLHVMGIGATLAAGLLLLLAALYRPSARPAALWAFAATVVLATLGARSGPAPGGDPVPFLVVAGLLLATSPAGRRLFRRTEPASPLLLLLVGLAAVPGVLFIAGQAGLQAGLGDSHAIETHYGMMVALVGSVLVVGLVAAAGFTGWRPLAWIAGGLMAFYGVMSVAFPAQASSVGTLWGGLAILWGVAFVLAGEYVHRTRQPTASMAEREPEPEPDPEADVGAV